ncbi:hypothetical protein ACPC54_19120 [Kitasatospora sp. NPDC094028]
MPSDAVPAPPAPGPLERVLGLHLAHLRATRAPAADATGALPLPYDTNDLESGRTTALREALEAGHRQALAQHYGASEREASEWLAGLTSRTDELTQFCDLGPGAAHRYHLAEAQAARIQIAAVLVQDLPVLTLGMRQFLHRGKASVKDRMARGLAAPLPGRGSIPDVTGTPCELCALLRSVLLDRGRSARELQWREREWYGRVAAARADAFLERIRRPGPATAEILINAVLLADLSTVESRTGQLTLLADLVNFRSLTLRVVPTRSPLLASQVLLDLDGVLIADPGTDVVAYSTGALGDFDDRSSRALPQSDTLALLRRAAAEPLTDPAWPWRSASATSCGRASHHKASGDHRGEDPDAPVGGA